MIRENQTILKPKNELDAVMIERQKKTQKRRSSVSHAFVSLGRCPSVKLPKHAPNHPTPLFIQIQRRKRHSKGCICLYTDTDTTFRMSFSSLYLYK